MARVLEQFEARTGVPVVVNTSLNTAGRPMVDDPRDALECFGSAPIDLLAIGPFVVRRANGLGAAARSERAGGGGMTYDVVIPTVGRASLGRLLERSPTQPDPLRAHLARRRPPRRDHCPSATAYRSQRDSDRGAA